MTPSRPQWMTKGSIALVLLVLATAAAAALDCPASDCPPCPANQDLLSCDGCRCSCAQDSDCGTGNMKCLPSRMSGAKVDLCYSTRCPFKACYAQEPPVAPAVSEEGASYGSMPDPLQGWGGDEFPDLPGFATDDEEDTDSSMTGEDQVLGVGDQSGKECAASCHVETLCAFKCSRVPSARCVVDKCRCEAKFVDENGNEPVCGFAPSQGGISAEVDNDEEATKDSSPPSVPGSDDIFNEFFRGDDDNDDITPTDPAMTTEKTAPPTVPTVPPRVPTLKSVGGGVLASTTGATETTTEVPKPSVFHQVIVPTLLVVIVIIAVFLLWKSYGKWKLWRKEKKEQRHMKDISTNLDQDENARMMMTVRDDVNV